MKNLIISLCAVAALIIVSSCKKSFRKTDTGLEYIIYTDKEGPNAKEGQIIRYDMVYKKIKGDSDSVFFSSLTRDTGSVLKLDSPSCKGCIEEGFKLLSAGDSATFITSADSFFNKTVKVDLPPFFKKGDKVKFDVKVHRIMSQEEHATMLKNAEDKARNNYITKNNITVRPTATGLYYIEKTPGTGLMPVDGDSVVVNYTGTFLDGKVYASSKPGQPARFPIGQMHVIPAWEEALKYMKEGGKANLIVPSKLAFGETGYPGIIPPSATLLFDIELVKVIRQSPTASVK